MTIEIFHDEGKEPGADHSAFQKWISTNATYGWYLNERADGKFMLHVAGCQHRIDHGGTYAEEGQSSTTQMKLCSMSRTELSQWATENGKTVDRCGSCK